MFRGPQWWYCQSILKVRPCSMSHVPSTGEGLNYSKFSEMCLYLMHCQHLPPSVVPLGFSSGLLLWVLLLSLQFSVRPRGQQRRSHLDMIKLEMQTPPLNPASQQDGHVGFQLFRALPVSSSYFFWSILAGFVIFESLKPNSLLFLSFLLIFPSSGHIFLEGELKTVIMRSSALSGFVCWSAAAESFVGGKNHATVSYFWLG